MRIYYTAKSECDELLIHEFVLADKEGNEIIIGSDETEASTSKQEGGFITFGRMKGLFLSNEDFSKEDYLNGKISELQEMEITKAFVNMKEGEYDEYEIELCKVEIEDGEKSYIFKPEQLATIHIC